MTVEPPGATPDDADALRRELDEARETLRAIRSGEFDALVINPGTGEKLFTLGRSERPPRLVEVAAEGSLGYFRAVAIDFDGTLAEGSVGSDTLTALAEVRARGVRVILVTGRIVDELRAVFPDVEDHVDALVAENGGVLVTSVGVRRLANPVDAAVSWGLSALDVVHRSGQVLIACAAADEPAALEVIRNSGLDYILVRNRDELMIMPAGVTKGTGLLAALADLRLSPHNTVGVGDAQNDHSLLEVCEVGVAVANAIESLRAHADVTLELPDGEGVAALLRGPLIAGRTHLHPRRWQITLGIDDSGEAVRLPASQLNVAVCGGTGSGKSYLTGLMCEQLIRLGYAMIVLDPEGDHIGLGELPDVLVTGGEDRRLASPAEIVQLLHSVAVVIDLSHLDAGGQAHYMDGLPAEIEAQRAVTGLPQWIVVDEAHAPFGRAGASLRVFNATGKGYLLVTWRPEDLASEVPAALDAVIAMCSPQPSSHLVDLTAAVADLPRAQIAQLLDGPAGRAVLAWRARPREAVAFTLGTRSTSHLRHQHKYAHSGVEPDRRFYFRSAGDTLTGAVAANLAQFEDELVRCAPGVLRHHCIHHDFSRWVRGVFRDKSLGADLAAAERQLTPDAPAAIVEQVRLALVAALQGRSGVT